ncbi:MAG: two-component system, chemotaxis family, protein-glutamate methylesterase/glutaminase [Actinomycetota bacterium]|nr:two-component system, chemotaxis family, protein-glutamate methylesterase/glutaminase [Actinomycetota bacterium]
MTRVVVVEDSLVQRAHLVHTLEAEGDIQVVGQAVGAGEAIRLVKALRPDVVTLDLQIPEGGGQHAIEQIMAFSPTPILVLSSTVTSRGSQEAVEALLAGALDALPKPITWDAVAERTVRDRVRALQKVSVVRHARGKRVPEGSAAQGPPRPGTGRAVMAIGASTGGPSALAVVLSGLAGLQASVLVVQHLHADFVAGLVSWMARASALPVQLAVHGDPLEPGVVYIAPGGTHLRMGAGHQIELNSSPLTVHRPSVDVLFSSVAQRAEGPKIGVLLTGMGEDGAAGLLELRQTNGLTIAQDEATSAVFGMPQAAQRLGAAARILPLADIAAAVTRWA